MSKDGLELEEVDWMDSNMSAARNIDFGCELQLCSFYDSLEDKKSIQLHKDSLIFDTGGFKNFSKVLFRKWFYKLLKDQFKVKTKIVNTL